MTRGRSELLKTITFQTKRSKRVKTGEFKTGLSAKVFNEVGLKTYRKINGLFNHESYDMGNYLWHI